MTTEPPKRRWFQFRLRTLLIAILVLSLPLSWFAVKLEKARRQREAVEALKGVGCQLCYGRGYTPSVVRWMPTVLSGGSVYVPTILFGGDSELTDAGLRNIHEFREPARITRIYLDRTDVTDAGLENLKGLTNLKGLSLDSTQVTDTGLKHLKGLSHLEELSVLNTQVTPEGVKKLQQALPNCEIRY